MKKITYKQMAFMRKGALHLSVIGLLCLWVISINRTTNQFISELIVDVDQIEGERNLITNNDIKKLVLKELPNDIMTQTITNVDIGMIENLLRSDTRILSVEVYIDVHQQLKVEVIQRRPVLRVMNIQKDQYYIDQAGDFIAKVSSRATRVPVVTGYIESFGIGEDISKFSHLKKAFQITKELRKDPVLKALIEQIHFEKNNRIVLIPKIGDEKIVLDHLDELKEKLNNLKVFYRHLAQTNNWGKYDEIDISYNNQVVPRKLENP